MSTDPQAIFEAALHLSQEDRLVLVSQLLDSLPADTPMLSADDPDLIAELDRRFANQEGAVSWSELQAEE
jgi:putative addiction module component (TIGR02574 family)